MQKALIALFYAFISSALILNCYPIKSFVWNSYNCVISYTIHEAIFTKSKFLLAWKCFFRKMSKADEGRLIHIAKKRERAKEAIEQRRRKLEEETKNRKDAFLLSLKDTESNLSVFKYN